MGEPAPQIYDTLINLPAITAALVNAIPGGSANSGIQSNGNASITMGKSSTDGEISFANLMLTDTAVLAFRASPYNSATSMQLDIYLNEALDTTILVNVQQETRHEVRYRIPVPAETTSIRIVSVGGGTSKRACMQELYLLKPKQNTTGITAPSSSPTDASKQLRDGSVVILRNNAVYTPLGQQIR